MSSSSGGGGSGGGCENHRATRCWWATWQEVQPEVQTEVQLGDKMVAGDSAEREQEPNWRLRLWTESLSGLSELRQSCYQPLRSLNRWKRKTSSPSATASFSPSSRSSASFFTHCVKFLFFLILFTFWRPSLCADCGKVSRNGEVIHHRQPPHQPHPPHRHTHHHHAPPTLLAVPLSPGQAGLQDYEVSPHVSVPLPVPQLPPQRPGAWIEPHSELVSADQASKSLKQQTEAGDRQISRSLRHLETHQAFRAPLSYAMLSFSKAHTNPDTLWHWVFLPACVDLLSSIWNCCSV